MTSKNENSSPESSAIDAIYSIEATMLELAKRVRVIEDNVKLLNNKLSKLSKQTASTPLPPAKDFSTHDPEPRQQKSQKIDTLVLGNVRLYGYIVNKAKMPLSEVSVNIYSDESKLIKSVRTDGDGYWEVRLPPGKFGVEYIHKNFKPVNKTVELLSDTKEYEVK